MKLVQGHEGKKWYNERIKVSIIQINRDNTWGEQRCMTLHNTSVGSVFDIAYFAFKHEEMLGSKADLPHWKKLKYLTGI